MTAALATVAFVGGVLIGLTGVGGGSLLTPAMILLFGINPLAAVSNDLMASLAIKPFGAALHTHRKAVHRQVLLLLCAGSVPAAFGGTLLLALLPEPYQLDEVVRLVIGVTLALTAGLMLVRVVVRRYHSAVVTEQLSIRPGATIMLGAMAGLLVGLTSIGSGSIVAAGLLMLYPGMRAAQLVGTDVTQAIPMAAAAAAGHLLFGQVQLALTLTLVLGGIPGVLLGAHLASRIPMLALRGTLAVVLVASSFTLLRMPVLVTFTTTVAVAVIIVTVMIVRRGSRSSNQNGHLASSQQSSNRDDTGHLVPGSRE